MGVTQTTRADLKGEAFEGPMDYVMYRTKRFTTPQTLVGFCWFVAAAFWNSNIQVLIDKHTTFSIKDAKVVDAGWAILPHIQHPALADTANGLILLVTLLGLIPLHPQGPSMLRRFFAVQGALFWLRGLSIGTTILPPPFDHCINVASDSEIVPLEALKVMLGSRTTCGDVLFSGHAVNITLLTLLWHSYWRPVYLPAGPLRTTAAIVRGAWWGYVVVSCFVIVATHFHYTADVVIGLALTLLAWGYYHSACVHGRDRAPKLLRWYEAEEGEIWDVSRECLVGR